MEFFDMLPLAGKIGFVCLMGIWGIRLWLNWRRAVREYPEIAYDKKSGDTHTWRWATPPAGVGFKTRQTGKESWLLLEPVRSFNEIVFSIFGACLFALAVYLMGLSIVRQVTAHDHMLVPSFIFGAVMVFLAWALCHTDAPVLAVARCRDRIKVQVRFAVYLRRCVSFRAVKPGVLSARGKVQGFLAMNTDQMDRLPDYYLFIKQRWRLSRRFLVRCTPSQGSWIVGGINQWAERTHNEPAQ